MTLSLLSMALPYSEIDSCSLPRTYEDNGYVEETFFIPATYSKVTTHEDEQFILAVTNNLWIRLVEGKDGWVLHSTEEGPDLEVLSCSILPDDTVLVADLCDFQFYDSSLELLSEVELNSIVDGLSNLDQFRSLTLR